MYYNAIELGKRIREMRNRMSLSQGEFAEKLGVNREHISNIECGRKNPSIDLLIDMVNLGDFSLDYLILGHRESANIRFQIQSIANELLELTKKM